MESTFDMAKSYFLRWHYEDLLAAMENHIRGVCPLGCVDRDALAWAIQAKLRAEAEHVSRAASNADEAGGHGEAVAPGWYP